MAKRAKTGTSKATVRERHARFVEAYIAKGENATQAYLEINPGVTVGSAAVEGHRWLKLPKIQRAIEKLRAELRAKFALTTDRVIQELARMSYFNPKRLVDLNGKPIPLHRLDDDTAAALASVEISEIEVRGRGKNKVVVNRLVKGRPFNKSSALEKSIKILRLYDKPPPPPPDEAQVVDRKETVRLLAFLLREREHEIKKEQQPPPTRAKKKKVLAPV